MQPHNDTMNGPPFPHYTYTYSRGD